MDVYFIRVINPRIGVVVYCTEETDKKKKKLVLFSPHHRANRFEWIRYVGWACVTPFSSSSLR